MKKTKRLGRRDTEAEILIDKELEKANCVFLERKNEILLSWFCQGWFHPGNGETDGLSLSNGLHVGGERVLLGTVGNNAKLSIIYRTHERTQACFWHLLTNNNTIALRQRTAFWLFTCTILFIYLFVFPFLHIAVSVNMVLQ